MLKHAESKLGLPHKFKIEGWKSLNSKAAIAELGLRPDADYNISVPYYLLWSKLAGKQFVRDAREAAAADAAAKPAKPKSKPAMRMAQVRKKQKILHESGASAEGMALAAGHSLDHLAHLAQQHRQQWTKSPVTTMTHVSGPDGTCLHATCDDNSLWKLELPFYAFSRARLELVNVSQEWTKIGEAQSVFSLAGHDGWLYCLDSRLLPPGVARVGICSVGGMLLEVDSEAVWRYWDLNATFLRRAGGRG